WQHDESLEWHVLQYPLHAGTHRWVRDLNNLYRDSPALYQQDFSPDGFAWVYFRDSEASVLAFLRTARNPAEMMLIICNFTPGPRENYRIGVPRGGRWRECLNSDAPLYGGSGIGNFGGA